VEREHETRRLNKDVAADRLALPSQNAAHAVRVIDNETAKTEQQ